MLAEFVENLVHFKGGEDRLDQHRRPDRPARKPEFRLRQHENVVPEPRLQVGLELGEIEVWSAPPRDELVCVVKEKEREIKEAAGDTLSVDEQMLLVEM